jgi:hypothetical protein
MAAGVLRLVALVALLAAGLAAAPRSASADLADAALFRQAAMTLGRGTPLSVARWLDRQPAVRAARLGADGRTLTIHFADGSRGVILPPVTRMTRLSLRPRALLQSQAQSGQSGKAAAFEPFATELGLSPASFDPVVSYLHQSGYAVDAEYDGQVTLATMATLAQYNVVYILSHSGVEDNGTGVLATAQETACKPHTSPDGTVQAVAVWGVSTCYLAITQTFIEKLPHFPWNSVVFLNGCTLLASHPFWVSLANQGVGTMVSWNGDALGQDDFLTAQAFFGEMQGGLSVSSAVDALLSLGYGRSSYQGKIATLGYRGDGTLTLKTAAAAVAPSVTPTLIPTDTPAPTRTPVPTPPAPGDTATPAATATASATPTATAVPMPTDAPANPSLSLPQTVTPGDRLEITVEHAALGSKGQLQVIYPSGSTVRQIQTADREGMLHFAYVQQAAEITRKNHLAEIQVRVQGQAESKPSMLTGRYSIGFDPVDMYIQQRHLAPGAQIAIWTHSIENTTVRLRIRSEGHTLRTAQMQGGKWSRLLYRLPAAVHSGQTIVVAARVNSGTGLDLATAHVIMR